MSKVSIQTEFMFCIQNILASLNSFIYLFIYFKYFYFNSGNEKGTCTCSGYFYDGDSKECKECPAGYMGLNCSITCRYPGFGKQCQEGCKCNAEYCDFRSGCFNMSIENATNLKVKKLSSYSGISVMGSISIITIIIIAKTFVFFLFLILTRILILHLKNKNNPSQTNVAASVLVENDWHNMDVKCPSGLPAKILTKADGQPFIEDLHTTDKQIGNCGERNSEKKTTDVLGNDFDNTDTRDGDNVYMFTFASFGSEMIGNSVHAYSTLQNSYICHFIS
ncbi:uncharacterized protein LOC134249417 isoform X1 [Saccostrea cucullata]|uniref:uncharacterized protein LOC134249417 isoform X1 n=1 Tax=Saccostrea cuccullata TaxID=36930 RepID=UPI002ED563A5